MKPFDWDSFTTALESLGCKVEYGCEKPGFYNGDEFLYSIEDIFPEIFHQTEEFDIFKTDDLQGRKIVKYSYSDSEDYHQVDKINSEYVSVDTLYSSVMIDNYRLKEAAWWQE